MFRPRCPSPVLPGPGVAPALPRQYTSRCCRATRGGGDPAAGGERLPFAFDRPHRRFVMRVLTLAALALTLGLSFTGRADELKSGPEKKVGGAFDVKAITGERAGDTLCYFCKYN